MRAQRQDVGGAESARGGGAGLGSVSHGHRHRTRPLRLAREPPRTVTGVSPTVTLPAQYLPRRV